MTDADLRFTLDGMRDDVPMAIAVKAYLGIEPPKPQRKRKVVLTEEEFNRQAAEIAAIARLRSGKVR